MYNRALSFFKRHKQTYYDCYPFFGIIIPTFTMCDAISKSSVSSTPLEWITYVFGGLSTGVALSFAYPAFVPISMGYYIYRNIKDVRGGGAK